MKETREQSSSPDKLSIKTTNLDEVNIAVRKISAQTQDEYFARLRSKHGSSFRDYFSASEYYTLLSGSLPRHIPDNLNRQALDKFRSKDPRYENLFIILNMKTIVLAAKKYFKNNTDFNDDLMHSLILKFHDGDFNPPPKLPFSQYIQAYCRSSAEKLTKKSQTENTVLQQIASDPAVLRVDGSAKKDKIKQENLYSQLESAIAHMPVRTQKKLYSRFTDGKTLNQIAMELNISRERVRVILAKAVVSLRYRSVLDRYPHLADYQKNFIRKYRKS